MRIVSLNTYDRRGGAARAAHRLHTGLRSDGVDAHMVVRWKTGHDDSVHATSSAFLGAWKEKLLYGIDLLPLGHRLTHPWGVGWRRNRVPALVMSMEPDIVHLHWICKGFLAVDGLRDLTVPLVWTLHDMWAFSGGCHYAGDCSNYEKFCGSCPQLGSAKERDVTYRVWNRKQKLWNDLDLTIVSPSTWLAKCVKNSALFRGRTVEVIPNGIDLSVFRPGNGEAARREFDLPLDKKIILMGAIKSTSDRRKGYHLLAQALRQLASSGWADRAELLLFGAKAIPNTSELGLKAVCAGIIGDDSMLASLYSAANVFVAPSTEENLSNTVVEALACGTPGVVFDIGGMPDIVDHMQTGYIAREGNIEDLARGIAWVLEDDDRLHHLSERARRAAEERFSLHKVTRKYRELYTELLQQSSLG